MTNVDHLLIASPSLDCRHTSALRTGSPVSPTTAPTTRVGASGWTYPVSVSPNGGAEELYHLIAVEHDVLPGLTYRLELNQYGDGWIYLRVNEGAWEYVESVRYVPEDTTLVVRSQRDKTKTPRGVAEELETLVGVEIGKLLPFLVRATRNAAEETVKAEAFEPVDRREIAQREQAIRLEHQRALRALVPLPAVEPVPLPVVEIEHRMTPLGPAELRQMQGFPSLAPPLDPLKIQSLPTEPTPVGDDFSGPISSSPPW